MPHPHFANLCRADGPAPANLKKGAPSDGAENASDNSYLTESSRRTKDILNHSVTSDAVGLEKRLAGPVMLAVLTLPPESQRPCNRWS